MVFGYQDKFVRWKPKNIRIKTGDNKFGDYNTNINLICRI